MDSKCGLKDFYNKIEKCFIKIQNSQINVFKTIN